MAAVPEAAAAAAAAAGEVVKSGPPRGRGAGPQRGLRNFGSAAKESGKFKIIAVNRYCPI